MPYRRTERYQRRIRAMQEGRSRGRMESELAPRWDMPALRRRLIVEDYDTGGVRRVVFDLYATTRIDSYRVEIDGKAQEGRLGWSRILDRLRLAMPRRCSPRWTDGC